MDARVLEAFYRSLLETVKDEQLPMEPSNYQKHHFEAYSDSGGFKLDLRKSSFKKIGKLLTKVDKDGVIEYRKPKFRKHKMITKVNRKHQTLVEFHQIYSLKRHKISDSYQPVSASSSHEAVRYPRVNIIEVRKPKGELRQIAKETEFAKLKVFDMPTCREMLESYIKDNFLDRKNDNKSA